jgi:hypothetical protein
VFSRDIELGEIIVVRLDIGSFGDRETHVSEDLSQFVHHLRYGMDAPLGFGALTDGQRDVGALGGEPLFEACSSRLPLRSSSASVTRVLTALTDWPNALRSSGGSLPSVCMSSETRPFLPSGGNTHLFKRVQRPRIRNLFQQALL